MPPARRGRKWNPPIRTNEEDSNAADNEAEDGNDDNIITQKDPQQQRVLRSADADKRPQSAEKDAGGALEFPILPSKFTDEELGLNNPRKGRGRRRKVKPSDSQELTTIQDADIKVEPSTQLVSEEIEISHKPAEEFLTVDASGIQDLVLTDSHIVTSHDPPPTTKRRGRKPKPKNVDTNAEAHSSSFGNFSSTSNLTNPPITVNENGILSIDMSHVASSSLQLARSREDSPSKGKTVRKGKNIKNTSEEGKPKIKRGRPKTLKTSDQSSTASSPVRNKRGRRTGHIKVKKTEHNGAQVVCTGSKSMADAGDLEPDEFIPPEELVGFEHIEIFVAKDSLLQHKLDDLGESESDQGFAAFMRRAQRAY